MSTVKYCAKVDVMSLDGLAFIGQKNGWTKCHTLKNRPFFEVDEQSVHFGWECHNRKLSQDRNVTAVNCNSRGKTLGMFRAGRNFTLSVCGWT